MTAKLLLRYKILSILMPAFQCYMLKSASGNAILVRLRQPHLSRHGWKLDHENFIRENLFLIEQDLAKMQKLLHENFKEYMTV